MGDKLVSAATFARDNAVQAFPLGGRVVHVAISGETPVSLDGVVDARASLFLIGIPPGHTLYVGNAAQVGDLVGDAARAVMFPLPASVLTFSVVDEDQAGVRLLGDADFKLPVLEAATLGEEA